MVDRPQQVAADTEQIRHDAVHRQDPLRVRGGRALPHLAFALAGRLVRHLRSIVLELPRAVHG